MFVLDKFGIVEQRGLGFETVKGLPKKNLPLPIVSFEEPYIVVMLPLTYEAAISVTQDELSEPFWRMRIAGLRLTPIPVIAGQSLLFAPCCRGSINIQAVAKII